MRRSGSNSAAGAPDRACGRLRREYLQKGEGPGMQDRLTARFWVDAYLTRLRLADIPAFVVAHGDDGAGAVLVKLNTLDGRAVLFQRGLDPQSGARCWGVLAGGGDADVEAAIARQRRVDPDLWVVEVEDRAGRHLLDTPGLDG